MSKVSAGAKKRPMDLSSFAPALTLLSRFLQRIPHGGRGRVGTVN